MPLESAKVKQTLADPKLQFALYESTERLKQKRRDVVSAEALPEYQELRTHAREVKKHTIENLAYYLERLERNVQAHGGKVIWASDAAEASDFIRNLAKEREIPLIVKSKSMTTEEIELNEDLAHHGFESVETDLGEFIIQLAHDKPYHIIAPAIHMTREHVADLFADKLGVERETVIEKQTMIARRVLREKFLKAGIGVSGANFLVADSGAVVIVENEGNARLTTSCPKIHITVAGIEKLIPRAQDLAVFLKLLGRSASGQPMSVYTSMLSGPRRPWESDGPEEFYLILLDNGRSKLLADEKKRESLYCIRCGACLNACPVYRKIGGHSYPWVYSGPIGAILTPQFHGVMRDPWLPFASSLCGACAEVCPVKIDIPKVLLDLRSDIVKARSASGKGGIERWAFKLWAFAMRHPLLYEWGGRLAAIFQPLAAKFEPLKSWTSEREAPKLAAKSFRAQWRERGKS